MKLKNISKKRRRNIDYGSQYIFKKDFGNVLKSLKKEKITSGREVDNFEKNLKNYFKCKFVVSCNSGTSALYLALLSINVKRNDNLILPAINFVAAANIAKILGANIYFCDVDPHTSQITPKLIEDCIKKNKLKKIKAVLTMFNGGYPRDIKKFYSLKKKYNYYLIEDSCHALGASYFDGSKYIKIGSCSHSDISTFSLHPLKTITTGEGGVVTTNNKKLYNQIKLLRSHGIVKKKEKQWYYEVVSSGFNFRLSDINCALGNSQLKKIDFIIKKRKSIYEYYLNEFKNFKRIVNIVLPEINTKPSYHLVIAIINFKDLKIDKEKFLKILNQKKIFCQFHYIPNYKFKNFKQNHSLKGSEMYYKTGISLPIHLKLKKSDIKYVIESIKNTIIKWKKN